MSTAHNTYLVSGMTCDHCKQAVVREVSAVPGVDRADVDLASGRLTVVGDAAAEAIAAAVREAGYEVTG
jgi:copper chaperone